jgi:hypothetical protein
MQFEARFKLSMITPTVSGRDETAPRRAKKMPDPALLKIAVAVPEPNVDSAVYL